MRLRLIYEQLLLEITVQDAWDNFYSDSNKFPILNGDRNLYDKIIAIIPPKGDNFQKGYFLWIYNLLKNNSLKYEDFYKAKEYLSLFDRFINRIEKKDLNAYKNLNDLYDVVSEFEDAPQDMATSKTAELKKLKVNEIDRVFENDDWKILIPRTERASCLIGKGTKWCTAADKSNNMFEYYNDKGPLYVLINKDTDEKYQLHFESNQIMDANDREIGSVDFFEYILEGQNDVFEFLQGASEDFWEFVLDTVDDYDMDYIPDIIDEAFNGCTNEYIKENFLSELRGSSSVESIYFGYMNETDPSNIYSYHFDELNELSDSGSDYDFLGDILQHLSDIGYENDENDYLSNYMLAKNLLIKHKIELDSYYKIDKDRTLIVKRIDMDSDTPSYFVEIREPRLENKSGYIGIEGLLNLLHQGQLF